MYNVLESIQKEAVVAYFKVLTDMCFEELRKTTKISVLVAYCHVYDHC
jgi:hypothetical protein